MKKAAWFLVLVMMASLLAACGGGTSSTSTPAAGASSSAGGSSAAASAGEKTELVMWGSWSGDQVPKLDEQLARFNSSQDAITVTYAPQDNMQEKLLTAIVGGELPDIILWDRYATQVYAARGALEPIDDLVSRDGVDMAKFYAPAVDELTYGTSLYGIPLVVDTRVLFYNKDMFAEANVDPASIKTWDDLEAAAIALTKRDGAGKLTQSGFSLKDPGLYNLWITQAGGQLVDAGATPPTTAFNSEQGLAVLEFWDKLMNTDKVYELGFEDSYGGNGFNAGVVAINYNGPWALANLDKLDLNYGLILPPKGPSGNVGAIMGGLGLAMPKGVANRDASWEFIKWWTTQPENGVEFAKISGWMPANLDAATDPYFTGDERYKVFVEAMAFASIRPKVVGYSDVEALALTPQLQKFMSGEIDAQTALATAQQQGDQILADAAAG